MNTMGSMLIAYHLDKIVDNACYMRVRDLHLRGKSGCDVDAQIPSSGPDDI